MKNFVSLLLAAAIIFSFAACTKKDNGETTAASSESQDTAQTQEQKSLPEATVAVNNGDVEQEDAEKENLQFNPIADITDAKTVKELVKRWATNGGDKLHSRDVINILLIGEDYVDGSSRSDAAIIVSVDKKNHKITLTSILRDSYTYMNINGEERYDKTNHSYAWGGAEKLKEVISDNYKIVIDHYVILDFEGFVSIVEALGGITVEVTQAEADYINSTSSYNVSSGKNVRLNGQQALYFARIRKLDGEAQRTERQRRLISACLKGIKGSSLEELEGLLKAVYPYVTTDYTEFQLASLGAQAMTGKWFEFDVISNTAPSEENRRGFNSYKTHTGNLSVWIVDYVKAARELQLSIYGQSNIRLSEGKRNTAIDLATE